MITAYSCDIHNDKTLAYTSALSVAVMDSLCAETRFMSSCAENRIFNIFSSLTHLTKYYPNFDEWFLKTALPGFLIGERNIFAEYDGDKPLGLVIAKRSVFERKICTVWVSDECQGQRLGFDLMKSAISWLNCTHPIITVNENVVSNLRPTLERLQFIETDRRLSCYKLNKIEHIFNGKHRGHWAH